MLCHELEELVLQYASGNLDTERRSAFELHVSECVECRERSALEIDLFKVMRLIGWKEVRESHPAVELLVKFVLYPAEVAEAERTGIQSHLDNCVSCSEEYERLRHFTGDKEALVATIATPTLEKIDRFIHAESRASQPGRTYTLRPWCSPDPEIQSTARLAAQAKDEKPHFPPILLSSDDERILFKAICDAHTGDIWLYVTAEDPALYRSVLIQPFGSSTEYLTDDEGRINLGPMEWPDRQYHVAELRLPSARFLLAPATEMESDQNETLLTSDSGDQIRIIYVKGKRGRQIAIEVNSQSPQDKKEQMKIAAREGGSTEIVMIRPTVGRPTNLEKINAVDRVELFLFH